MTKIVVLDTGPLGLVTNPLGSQEAQRCSEWMESLLERGRVVAIPEIADYELRRELVRAHKARGIQRLDALKAALRYLPLDTWTMVKASEYWALARNMGRSTADDKALDGDVILAAQAARLHHSGEEAVIATNNVGHLGLFTDARVWSEIR